MKRKVFFIGFIVVLLIGILIFIPTESDKKVTSITIAVPKSDKVENFSTNYYTNWLEQKTGYQIQFEYIPPGYEREYIHTMITSDNSEIDGVFLSENEDYLTVDELNEYGRKGFATDLSAYISDDSNFHKIMKEYESYGLYDKVESDGAIYYYPNMDTARKSRNLQVFWINSDWLKTLNMAVPKTTEELKQVLLAFRDKDPNGNGVQDELPLISCEENISLQSYHYLLNAYVYDDPIHCSLYREESGQLSCSMEQDAFRDGLLYCNEMYRERLLTDNCFSYSAQQLMEIVNSPEDLVGAFTCKSIADVIYPNFPDVLAKYIYVPPLIGPEGSKHAVCVDYEPKIGGYIPSNSRHKKEVCEIMDQMLSDDGVLISEFGERGVDWKVSDKSDLSIYGNKAYITTVNYLGDRMQNKHFAGVGPQILKDIYANGVTWNGDNSLVEYHDVRAVNLYENYYLPKAQQLEHLDHDNEIYRDMCLYTNKMIKDFIVGDINIRNEETWNAFVEKIRVKRQKISEMAVK